MADAFVDAIAEKVAARVLEQLGNRERSIAVQPRLLGIEGAAIYLGRTPKAVQHMVARGALPVVKFGEERRVSLDVRDLDKVIEEGKL